jgi:ankyrin repeat protein
MKSIKVVFLILVLMILPIGCEKKPTAIVFHKAIQTGDINQVRVLISKGADVNSKGDSGRTPLHLTAVSGDKGIAELLIYNGAKIETKSDLPAGLTPLHWAILSGHKDMVELLISKDADVNRTDNDAITPLQGALIVGNKEIVDVLIAKGADLHVYLDDNIPPWWAKEKGEQEICEQLYKHLQNKQKEAELLCQAAKEGDIEKVKTLISKGAYVNIRDLRGCTPLSEAAEQGHLNIVKLLVAKGADVNAENTWRHGTPLYLAARKGNKNLVQFLIDNGAELNAGKIFYMSPFDRPDFERHKKWAELLVAEGADITIHQAVLLGDLERVKTLIKSRADVNIEDGYGSTPLHIASVCGFTEIAKFLIKKGASVDARTGYIETPLHFACFYGHKDVVELLLAKNADVNAQKSNGRTPLSFAKDRGHIEIVELLLKHEAEE